ncbi:MAG: hypothetical protein H9W82_13370 [Lactobacillus sp.]|nr:hypothetical protein [Lactobacillus sp.]
MKTSEFIEKVEKLGFTVNVSSISGRGLFVKDEYEELIAYVSSEKIGVIDTTCCDFGILKENQRKQLFNLLTEYAVTPIAERRDKTIEEKAKDYIQEYAADNLSFESARDFLECCSLYITDNREFQSRNMHTEEQLAEYAAIYDWYHEHSAEFIRMWLEVVDHE